MSSTTQNGRSAQAPQLAPVTVGTLEPNTGRLSEEDRQLICRTQMQPQKSSGPITVDELDLFCRQIDRRRGQHLVVITAQNTVPVGTVPVVLDEHRPMAFGTKFWRWPLNGRHQGSPRFLFLFRDLFGPILHPQPVQVGTPGRFAASC